MKENLLTKILRTFVIFMVYVKFSTPKMPQQNGVIEKKNRIMHEMPRVHLLVKDASLQF